MTEIEAIITAAKRYCIDNFNYWSKEYSEKGTDSDYPLTYSENDYNLFPRYNALGAILNELQYYTGKEFHNTLECKKALKRIGQESQGLFTVGIENNIESSAIQNERDKFLRFIDNIDNNFLSAVEPLPYLRRLKEDERTIIKQKLKDIWEIDDYWFPLIEKKTEMEAIFLGKENISQLDYEKISKFINSNSIDLIYEVSEDHMDYELDSFCLDADCYETFCFDKTYDWLVYVSHEGTISFGGNKLIDFVRTLFFERKDLINQWN